MDDKKSMSLFVYLIKAKEARISNRQKWSLKMKTKYDELKFLINYIQSTYLDITFEWMRNRGERFNLKKSLVSSIDVNGAIYKNIMEYVQLLNNHSIVLKFSSICSCKVMARVKTHNSIEYKIQSYKTSQHEFGQVPINKCMNDLFGVRIILDFPVTLPEIQQFIDTQYAGKYRCIDSSKGEYKAVHLYFREDNWTFPWELQIWRKDDVETNFASHKKYKQEYTTWEKARKGGEIISE